jgi:hypothetical protein
LGLAITSNIMRSLGGSIACSSLLGRGTTMKLELPLDIGGRKAGGGGGAAAAAAHSAAVGNFRLNCTGIVLSIVAKESLGAAIGGTVNSLGAMHERLPAGGSFPHTEHQRQMWGGEIAATVSRASRDYTRGVVLVMEECYLAPIWSEWHKHFKDIGGGGQVFPPIVLIVGKKMKVTDLLPSEKNRPRQASFGFGGASLVQPTVRSGVGSYARLSTVETDGGGSEDGDEEGEGGSALLTSPARRGNRSSVDTRTRQNNVAAIARREEEWQALLHSVVQVIRPIKPTCLKEALRKCDGMLDEGAVAPAPAAHQEPSGGGEGTAMGLPGGGGGGGGRRMTRSEAKRVAMSDDITGDSIGGEPAVSGGGGVGMRLRRSGGVNTSGTISMVVPPLPASGWVVYKLNAIYAQLAHSLKAPGFNPRAYQERSWFHKRCFFKCNSYRYVWVGGAPPRGAVGAVGSGFLPRGGFRAGTGAGAVAGLYKLNAVDPYLESTAWFQPLSL